MLADHGKLTAKLYEAYVAGKVSLEAETRRWQVDYHGDCQNPLRVPTAAIRGALCAVYQVRCRKCKTCLRARTNYWGFAAMNMTMNCEGRTWFGTLTCTPQFQEEIKQRAFEEYSLRPDGTAPNWEDPKCDVVFNLRRRQLLIEVQRFWKRLRKAGHAFSYFLVFERHKSGLPHMHFLLHEKGAPITKRAIQSQWPFGHSNVSIVGGRGKRAAAPEKAAWYVVKYLSKSNQSRQLASRGYRPLGRNHTVSNHNFGAPQSVKTTRRAGVNEVNEPRDATTTNDDATREGVNGVSDRAP